MPHILSLSQDLPNWACFALPKHRQRPHLTTVSYIYQPHQTSIIHHHFYNPTTAPDIYLNGSTITPPKRAHPRISRLRQPQRLPTRLDTRHTRRISSRPKSCRGLQEKGNQSYFALTRWIWWLVTKQRTTCCGCCSGSTGCE